MTTRIIVGNCIDVMPTLDACSVDAIVCDPPYGLSFMGKDWDHGVPGEHFWREAFRVAKPGAHLIAFGGTRTHHRLMVAIEDAGWEIRDTLGWLFGSGFPKSLDVSKAIDKAAGATRDVIGKRTDGRYGYAGNDITGGRYVGGDSGGAEIGVLTAPATDAARQWQGWGTALKPAWEPIILARKPLESTVAANVQRHGTGALNIDECRVAVGADDDNHRVPSEGNGGANSIFGVGGHNGNLQPAGRWPANIIHDGSDEVVALFPESDGQSGAVTGDEPSSKTRNTFALYNERATAQPRNDAGSAARFFYCAKADAEDRNAGLYHVRPQFAPTMGNGIGGKEHDPESATPKHNHHPTVKPTELMRYLCRLITPPGGLILDPFAGSGSTGKAALLEGFRFIGIELSSEYAEIARARLYGTAPLFAETAA